MELAGITPESVSAQQASDTAARFAMQVTRKVLALAVDEGAMVAQMINSSPGVGQSIDTHA